MSVATLFEVTFTVVQPKSALTAGSLTGGAASSSGSSSDLCSAANNELSAFLAAFGAAAIPLAASGASDATTAEAGSSSACEVRDTALQVLHPPRSPAAAMPVHLLLAVRQA
uniref:Uncharacterized protein n=1 Tax=Chlamydomonas leiostraca TaxID=1034604 RepID=A0A7S0WMJ6_9CHLO|mmetsp:Transcript_19322/g.49164  ORF Transcript_19322/g.49164 Transcript_19322/m.49164 type:complete len:112 (+) Transcript_19322:228-563(+)